MSFFVTCTPNDGKIVGFIDFALNPKLKYEVALVEMIYSLDWHVQFGSIGLEINGTQIMNSIEEYDYSYLDSLQYSIDSIIKSADYKFVKQPSIKYDYGKKLLSFDTFDPKVKFICDDIFKENLGLYLNEFSSIKVHTSSRLEKTRSLNVYCDLISDQFVGLSRSKLLRSIKVEGDAHKLRIQMYSSPFYLNLARTDFRYIYLDIFDQNKNSVQFEKELFVKLHFRVQR